MWGRRRVRPDPIPPCPGVREIRCWRTLAHHQSLDWLAAAARDGAEADLIAGPDDPYFSRCLDYATGDRYLASLAAR
jgi:hypothetical protein